MTAREIKTRQEDRSAANEYLKKAADNYEQMLSALNASNWNATATLAIQCAISSADAICVQEKGLRSVSQDHLDVCDLMAGLPLESAQEKAKQLRKVIAQKNLIQYESRSVRKAEAEDIAKITTRIYQWVKEKCQTSP